MCPKGFIQRKGEGGGDTELSKRIILLQVNARPHAKYREKLLKRSKVWRFWHENSLAKKKPRSPGQP
jgi:hypothetical protein